ncbi:MAG: hypothetical protein N3E39_03000 [Candidatus Methanomethylicia archaeon]|nr:hypothetical protein [Candidatus Methanomethylicia archaeon]
MGYQRKIRVKYAGTVNFASRIISTFTGLIFVTMVSRRLTEEEFGLWSFFGVWLQYFVIPSTLINYWAIRYASRGFKVEKTTLITNILLTFISIIVFFIISNYILYSEIKITYLYEIILILILQIPAEYLYSSFETLTTAIIPELIGYAVIISELVKVSTGFILINYYQLGLIAALLSYVIARYFHSFFLAFMLKNHVKGGGFDKVIVIKWFKLSWIPAYSMLPGYISNLETPIITLLINFTDPSMPLRILAHTRAVSTIISVVSYSGLLSFALYPKILSGGSGEDVTSTLKYVLTFAFPMVFGTICMSEAFLSLLGVEYTTSYQALYIGAIGVLPSLISGIFSSSVMGYERVDLMENSSIKDYFKSKLFIYPSISLISSILYIIIITSIFSFLSTIVYDPSIFVFVKILISTLFSLILCFKFYLDAKKIIGIKFPWINISRYLISSIAMFIVLWLLGIGRIVSPKFIDAFKLSLLGVSIGVSIYGFTLFILDCEFRNLVKYSIGYIKKILKFNGN